jgi:putative restriction endonuclease
MIPLDLNHRIRTRALSHVDVLAERSGGTLHWDQIERGFTLPTPTGDVTIRLASRPRGIFRPKELQDGGALSIKTTVTARSGREARYDDGELLQGSAFLYRYQGTDPFAPDNVALRRCRDARLPIIYFKGIVEARYEPIICMVTDELPGELAFTVEPLAAEDYETNPIVLNSAVRRTYLDRRYAMRSTWTRLHQHEFRDRVLMAYEERCAICRLRHRQLLDAAHIVGDREEKGVAATHNGLSLCKLHHAAFDAHLIGVDPHGRVHLRPALRDERDGPMLEHGLRAFDQQVLLRPKLVEDAPSPELLEIRWERFKAAAG